jgi:hypothetical protein
MSIQRPDSKGCIAATKNQKIHPWLNKPGEGGEVPVGYGTNV